MYLIIYQAYGTWKLSGLFETEKDVIKHRDMYITTKEKDYNKNVEIRFIKLPIKE